MSIKISLYKLRELRYDVDISHQIIVPVYSSNYAKHILEQLHTFGSIDQIMEVLQYREKGTHVTTVERFFIYVEFSKNNHLNDEQSIYPNKIFDALLKPHQP